ncbi:MAG: FtsX-like permease family protein, partial [Gemmatimonadota bacterium]
MIGEAVRSLWREPVTSTATAACVAVGVATATPFLSLVRVEAWWPPALASVVRPSAPGGTLENLPLGWSAEAIPADGLRAAGLDALVDMLLLASVLAILAAAVAVWVLQAGRTRRRRRELAVRRAVGARRADLRRQVRVEVLLLAAAGGVTGGVLAMAATAWVRSAGARGLVWEGGGSPVLAFLTAFLPLLATAAGASSVVLAAGRLVGRRTGPRSAVPGGSTRPPPFQDLLVVGAVAGLMSVVIGAGVLVRSHASSVADPAAGAGSPDTLILRLDATGAMPVADRTVSRALDLVQRHPDTLAQAVASPAAWAGLGPVDRVVAECRCWRGQEFLPVITPRLGHAAVGPGFFEVLRMELEEGRGFRPSDRDDQRRVAVVDRRLFRLTGGGGSPVGKWIRVAGASVSTAERTDDRYRIVGIVEERRAVGTAIRGPDRPLVYVPSYLHPAGRSELVVRTRRDPATVAPRLAAALTSAIPELRVEAATLEERVRDLAAPLGWTSAGFGAVSMGILVLAILAVGGLAADETRRQRSEMAIRRAVGARRRDVVLRVLGRSLVLATRATVTGLVGA